MLFSNVHKIFPNLWIGNKKIINDTAFFKQNNIDLIVNCTPDLPFPDISIRKSICTLRIPVYDSGLEKDYTLMESYFHLYIPLLSNTIKNNKNTLIYCKAGKQRSCIVAAAILFHMFCNDCNNKQLFANSIFEFIQSKRRLAFNFGFQKNFYISFCRYFDINYS
jgi:protein-tyrosine phosphatase